MYEASNKERKALIEDYGYKPETIGRFDIESDKVRRGIPVDLVIGILVAEYQSDLQAVRRSLKKWWQFWK